MISLIQHFEADFLWKVSLKILNSGIIQKAFTHVYSKEQQHTSACTYVPSDQHFHFSLLCLSTKYGEKILYML